MRIGGVDFPEPLLNALRDGRLVVFAGAGVSMGPPANLPGFRELARQIAEGTGFYIGEFEAEDQFLGRLKDTGPDVHQIAAQRLQRNNPKPTELHRHLLRLYRRAKDTRIVTTNFDQLFEEAAASTKPTVFNAPVLPLGQRFQGIVHIHGSVNQPEEMVLTDRDFGRAYLTESDGWARRFLVDFFANNTVLFVGYSHSDTIMTYLTPSLPRDDTTRRYALIGEENDDLGRWLALGVQPITFRQGHPDYYGGLDKAVGSLADHIRRGILDWQREITAIASVPPPIDEESAGIIEYALSTPEATQFFTRAAESPDWIDWLDRRHHLATLFTDGKLTEQEVMLASWLSRRFALAHDGALFRTIESHRSRLNPEFWKLLSWQMQDSIPKSPDAAAMTRWVLFLASVTPANGDDIALSWIAEASDSVGAMDALLRAYEAMTGLVNRELPRLGGRSLDRYHYELETMLTDCLKPNLPQIAEAALEITTRRLSERYSVLAAWGRNNAAWDSDSFFRSAIEPHAQDNVHHDIDALIDVARECLDWLAADRPDAVKVWSERHIHSQTPLLRRLAIHILPARTDLSADDKIAWLLEHSDVNELAAKHELFKAAGSAYPQTSRELRAVFLKAVLDFQMPESEDYDAAHLSAGYHFDWMHWLSESAPYCELTKQMLNDILARYPEFLPSEHPDFFHWSKSWAGARSPWTVELLLERPAAEMLSALLEYQPTDRERFDGYHCSAMLDTIREAAKQNPDWGFDLADSLAASGEWNADLWHSIFRAWAETEMDGSQLHRALSLLSADDLHKEHVHDLAYTLSELARKANGAEDGSFLPKANAIAVALQQYAAKTEIPNLTSYVGGVLQPVDWLTTAINHPSGKLAEFWLRSIALWRNQQGTPPQSLNSEYLSALTGIVQENSITGKLGRAILASRLQFILHVDEAWSLDNLLPLFDTEHQDFQPAWEGFLALGRITPQVADSLREASLEAVQFVKHEPAWRMQHRFVDYYTEMLVWFVSGPTDKWITKLLNDSDEEIRRLFAERIDFILRSSDEEEQKKWWDEWLKGYWENRLQNVPVPLDDGEVETMTEWTSQLTGVYSEAVELTIRMPAIRLRRPFILHELNNSDLPQKHPEAVAKLLIHLNKGNNSIFMSYGTGEIIDKLLQYELDEETVTGLKEVAAKIGL